MNISLSKLFWFNLFTQVIFLICTHVTDFIGRDFIDAETVSFKIKFWFDATPLYLFNLINIYSILYILHYDILIIKYMLIIYTIRSYIGLYEVRFQICISIIII